MRFILIILIAGSCLVFSGCPYESDVPLGEPDVSADKTFSGRWMAEKDSSEMIDISIKDSMRYQVIRITRNEN